MEEEEEVLRCKEVDVKVGSGNLAVAVRAEERAMVVIVLNIVAIER